MKPITANPKRTDLYIALALAVFTFIIFANTIGNDYNLDDELVTNHQRLTSQGITAIPEIFTSSYYDNQAGSSYEYRPVALSSFAIEHTFFDESPSTSHAINVLLYALTIMLLYLTLRFVLPGDNFATSFITTLIFTVHPLHTEVVASIKNRDEILCFLGGTVSWYYAHQFLKDGKRKWFYYVLFIFFFVFGILSKRSILSYAFIIPLSFLWFNNIRPFKIIWVTLPLAISFYLLSPSSNNIVNWLSVFTILIIPFAVKGILYLPLPNINIQEQVKIWWGNIGIFDEAKNKPAENTRQGFYYSFFIAAALLVFLVWLYAVIVTDQRFVQLAIIFLLVFASFFIKPSFRLLLLFSVAILLILLAFNYGIPPAVEIGMVALCTIVYHGNSRIKLWALIAIAISVVVYVLFWPNSAWLAMGALLILFGLFYFSKDKKSGLLVVAIYLGGTVFTFFTFSGSAWFTPLFFGLCYLLLWFKRTTYFAIFVVLTGCALTIGNTSIHPIAYNRLHKQYDVAFPQGRVVVQVPSKSVVPSAGRKLDMVENPLIKANSHERSATSFFVMGKYIQLLTAPVTLRFYYGFNQIEIASWQQVFPWLVLLGLVSSILFVVKYRSRYPLITLAILVVWISLFFISNITVLVAGIIAERLAYILSFWACLLVSATLVALFNNRQMQYLPDFKQQPVLLGLLIAIIVSFSLRTIARNADWKDKFTLYGHDIKSLPNSAKAQQLLGAEYLQLAAKTKIATKKQLLLDSAQSYLSRAIEIAPEFHSAVYNIAYLYLIKDNCDSSNIWMKRSITMQPNMSAALFFSNIARCNDNKNQLDSAALYYEKAIAADPKILDYYTQLGYVKYRQGKLKESIAVNLKALKQFPGVFDLYINTAKAYLTLNDNAAALQLFEGAFKLQPNDANLALMIVDLNNRVGDKTKAKAYEDIAKGLKK